MVLIDSSDDRDEGRGAQAALVVTEAGGRSFRVQNDVPEESIGHGISELNIQETTHRRDDSGLGESQRSSSIWYCMRYRPSVFDNTLNNVASDRAAIPEPNVSEDESDGYLSLPENFRPFEQNQNFNQHGVHAIPMYNQDSRRRLSIAELHAVQMTSGTWIHPEFPAYCTLESRLESFSGQLVQLGINVYLESEQLANAGFFLRNGKVQCYHCGASVRNWQQGMNPIHEHVLISPRCRAVINV